MKRFIISFFSILLIALTSVGGGLLLSACDNSSYSENVGGGVGDSTNEDVNTPSDETPTDDPNGENENLGSEENNDEKIAYDTCVENLPYQIPVVISHQKEQTELVEV